MLILDDIIDRKDRFSDQWWEDMLEGQVESASEFGGSARVASESVVRFIILQLMNKIEDLEKCQND
jgi:hypothetical protein